MGNRVIKFRGKRIDNGEWVVGWYLKAKGHWHKRGIHEDWIICHAMQNGGWFALGSKHAVAPETVGQYTGLKDKNGVEIYEGDTLEGFSVYPTKDTFQSKILGNVYYNNRGTWDCCSFLLGDINEQMEVIGNIYDNPELIGSKE